MSRIARLGLSCVLAVFLAASITAPAFAIIWAAPAVGSLVSGVLVRGAVSGAARATAYPLGQAAAQGASWAARAQAANTIGVMMVGTVAFCGTGSVLDVCTDPKFKVKTQDTTHDGGEVSASIPATVTTTAPINVTSGTPGSVRYSWRTYPGDPGSNTLVDNETHLSATSLCQSSFTQGKCVTMNGAGSYTWDSLGSGTYCYYKKNGGVTVGCGSAWSYVKNPQACPSGYTNQGGTCVTQDCPAGYTMNSGTCSKLQCPAGFDLSGTMCNPVAGTWTPDGAPTFVNSGGTWTLHPKDPDIPDTGTLPNPMEWTGMDEYGNPAKVQIVPETNGGVTIKGWTQGVSPGGQTTTTYNSIYINPAGTFSSAITNVYNGDIVTNSGTSTPPATTALPTDYQRDATGQQTNTKLQTIIDGGVKVKEDGTPTTGDFTSANTKVSEAETALKGVPTEAAKTDGKDTGWKIGFTPPSGCTNPAAFAMPKVNLVADLCRWEPQIGAFMSFVWYLLTLGSCLSMIRGAMVGGNS